MTADQRDAMRAVTTRRMVRDLLSLRIGLCALETAGGSAPHGLDATVHAALCALPGVPQCDSCGVPFGAHVHYRCELAGVLRAAVAQAPLSIACGPGWLHREGWRHIPNGQSAQYLAVARTSEDTTAPSPYTAGLVRYAHLAVLPDDCMVWPVEVSAEFDDASGGSIVFLHDHDH